VRPRSPSISLVLTVSFSYLSQTAATNEWLVWNSNGASYFGPNYWTQEPNGRDSVRLESKNTYNNVLVIAEFSWVPGSFVPTLKPHADMTGSAGHGLHSGRPISIPGPMAVRSISLRGSIIKTGTITTHTMSAGRAPLQGELRPARSIRIIVMSMLRDSLATQDVRDGRLLMGPMEIR
jgi:hypothetical protein